MKIKEEDLLKHTMTDVNVLVKIEVVEEVTKGGIILTRDTTENLSMSSVQGVLVNHGASAFHDGNNNPWHNKPQIGDQVLCAKYAGLKIDTDSGAVYRLMTDLDIKMFKTSEEV